MAVQKMKSGPVAVRTKPTQAIKPKASRIGVKHASGAVASGSVSGGHIAAAGAMMKADAADTQKASNARGSMPAFAAAQAKKK